MGSNVPHQYESAAQSIAHYPDVTLDKKQFEAKWLSLLSNTGSSGKHDAAYWRRNSERVYDIYLETREEINKFRKIMENPTEEALLAGLKIVISETLGIHPEKVSPDARLISDLGAESLDFIDLVFRLEKYFKIKIPRGELFPEHFGISGSSFIEDGMVTNPGIAELRNKLPHADIDSFAEDPRIMNISDVFTVRMIINFLLTKLPRKE